MYGSPAVELRSADLSVGTSGIGEVLAIYLPESVLSAKGERFHLTDSLILFFSSPSGADLLSQVKRDDSLCILPVNFLDFRKICGVELFFELLEDQKKPKEALLCMSAAVHKVLMDREDVDLSDNVFKVNIRVYNYPESLIALKNLKAAYIGILLVSLFGLLKFKLRPLCIFTFP